MHSQSWRNAILAVASSVLSKPNASTIRNHCSSRLANAALGYRKTDAWAFAVGLLAGLRHSEGAGVTYPYRRLWLRVLQIRYMMA